jgi:ABC-type transporter Mla MlaB component
MFRIHTDDTTPDAIVLRLAGNLRSEWVVELRRACDDVLHRTGAGTTLTLDLSDVTFVDAAGVALCAELAARGVALVNCSLFTAQQLKGSTDVEW